MDTATTSTPSAILKAWRSVVVALAVAVTFYMSLVQLSGVDFWLQVKVGDIIANTHRIPARLEFPFTEIASRYFNAHEWLPSVLFYEVLQIIGEHGMAIWTASLGCLLFALLTGLSWQHAPVNLPQAMLSGLAGLIAENYRHVLRPELLALILMALYWTLLEAYARKSRYWHLAAMALLVAMWANSHGSFVLAIFLAVMYAVGASIDIYYATRSVRLTVWGPGLRYAPLLAIVCIFSCATPSGLELVRFVFDFGSENEIHQYIAEWMPTFSAPAREFRGFWIALIAWLLIFASLLTARKSLRCVDWLIFAFFTILAAKAIRFPVYLSFLLALYLPLGLRRWTRMFNLPIHAYGLLGALTIFTLGICITFGNAAGARPFLDVTNTKFSNRMVATLKSPAYKGNVLNTMELGAELIYLSYPRLRPAIDCRLDSYGLDYYLYIDRLLYDQRQFDEFIARYDVRYLLLSADVFKDFVGSPMWASGRWKVILVDLKAAFVERADYR